MLTSGNHNPGTVAHATALSIHQVQRLQRNGLLPKTAKSANGVSAYCLENLDKIRTAWETSDCLTHAAHSVGLSPKTMKSLARRFDWIKKKWAKPQGQHDPKFSARKG
jgi:hypothetical protein